jgi:hypothetical protein
MVLFRGSCAPCMTQTWRDGTAAGGGAWSVVDIAWWAENNGDFPADSSPPRAEPQLTTYRTKKTRMSVGRLEAIPKRFPSSIVETLLAHRPRLVCGNLQAGKVKVGPKSVPGIGIVTDIFVETFDRDERGPGSRTKADKGRYPVVTCMMIALRLESARWSPVPMWFRV